MHPHICGKQLVMTLQSHPMTIVGIVITITECLSEAEGRCLCYINNRYSNGLVRGERIDVLGIITNTEVTFQQRYYAIYATTTATTSYVKDLSRCLKGKTVFFCLIGFLSYDNVTTTRFNTIYQGKLGSGDTFHETLQQMGSLIIIRITFNTHYTAFRLSILYYRDLCLCCCYCTQVGHHYKKQYFIILFLHLFSKFQIQIFLLFKTISRYQQANDV